MTLIPFTDMAVLYLPSERNLFFSVATSTPLVAHFKTDQSLRSEHPPTEHF